MAYVTVDKTASDIPPGTMTLASAGPREALLTNVDGTIYATARRCPHAGAALSYGLLKGNELTCISHGATYDVITGELLEGPGEYGLFATASRLRERISW